MRARLPMPRTLRACTAPWPSGVPARTSGPAQPNHPPCRSCPPPPPLLTGQALQLECKDLRHQLARCTPAEFERLHSELIAAQRAAGEAPILRDQAERQRALWREAEDRLAKLQVRGGRGWQRGASRRADPWTLEL
jgi:hypothetical protein